MSNECWDADPRCPLDKPTGDRPDGCDRQADEDLAGRPSIDVTVGRSAADYLQVLPPDVDVAPESAVLHPVLSEFARELFERIELARGRVMGETDHLDAVGHVSELYRPAQRPKLRLLP